MNLSRINLNLLVTLDALLTEANVTKAGKKIFLSQSSVSCALKQLRELFHDPLLVKQGRGMIFTPRAQALTPALKNILKQIELLLEENETFDPASSNRIFTLGLTEYADFILSPYLYAYINKQAPNVKLIIKHLIPMGTKKVFENGDVELGIGMQYELPYLVNDTLFKEQMVCIARKDHPLFKKRLTLKSYCEAQHLQFSLRDRAFFGITNEELAKLGIVRNVALMTTHAISGLYALTTSDLIATVQEGFAKQVSKWFKLVIQKPPFSLPEVVYTQIWHQRLHHDPGHQWLRGIIKNIAHSQKLSG